MSYHRSGHSEIVAVSLATNTMAPLSPSRRYNNSNSSTTTTGIGSTSTTTKFPCKSPGTLDRPSYSAATSAGLTSSKKNNFASTRSAISYNDIGFGSAAGKLSKCSSISTSSASSTLSTSRDRNSRLSSTSFQKDDLFEYRPSNYTPAVFRDNSNSLNGRSKAFSLSTSTGGDTELHGGDERDSHRDRRDRCFSNDISSSTIPHNRWSSNRQVKRRNNPLNMVHNGNDKNDCIALPSEVTVQDQNGDSDLTRNNHENVNNINIDNDNNGNNNDRDNDTLDERTVKQQDNNINNDDNLNHHGHPTSTDKSRTLDITPSSSSSLSSPTDSIWTSPDFPVTESSCGSSITTPSVAPLINTDRFYSSVTSGGGSGNPRVCSSIETPTNTDNTELFTNNNDQDCNTPIFGTAQSEVSSGDTLFKRQASISSACVNIRGCATQWTNFNDSNTHQINKNDNGDGINGGFEANLASSDISVDKISLEDISLGDNLLTDTSDDVFKTPGSLDNDLSVTTRPNGTQDDLSKPSTSRPFFGNWDSIDNNINASSTNSTQQIDVHQPTNRGFNDRTEESSTSRSPRNRIPARRDESHGLNGLKNLGNTF